MQRLRVRFTRGDEIKFISHLDIMRLWERALTRAGIRITYSEGFSPHPRLSLAAPLAVGVTGESELLDIYTADTVSPHWFTDAMNKQLPDIPYKLWPFLCVFLSIALLLQPMPFLISELLFQLSGHFG